MTNIPKGIALLARFRPEGLALFPATPQAFLNSLTPVLAITLVQAIPEALTGAWRNAIMRILISLVLLLAPAVLSHVFAGVMRRSDALWLRYVIALNWCQAVFSLVMVLTGLLFGRAGMPSAMPGPVATNLPMLALSLYWLALYWFMTRVGLQLSAWRAVLAVVLISLATGVLVIGPEVIGMALSESPPA